MKGRKKEKYAIIITFDAIGAGHEHTCFLEGQTRIIVDIKHFACSNSTITACVGFEYPNEQFTTDSEGSNSLLMCVVRCHLPATWAPAASTMGT